MQGDSTIRMVFPQWQGGNEPAYALGARLLDWLAPTVGARFEVPVTEPDGPLAPESGMPGRSDINRQLDAAWKILKAERPARIVTLGGDCLVSLAPFAWLSERYGDKLGVLWVDTHPDVQTPDQYENAHAQVLGALLGNGDPDLIRTVDRPVDPARVLIAGIHDPLPHEKEFLEQRSICTISPQEVKSGGDAVLDWIEANGIEHLAVHLDLDVLDPQGFRSVLFAKPGRQKDDFGNVAEGQLDIADAVALIGRAASKAAVVGLTISEHLPWDAINLKDMLERLPLIGSNGR